MVARLIPVLNEECDLAFTREIGAPGSWTSFSIATLVSKIMLRTTSRVLVGKELCREDRYLDAAQKFSDSIFMNGLVVSMLPLRPLRFVMSYVISSIHRRKLKKAMNEIIPVVQARCNDLATRREGGISSHDTEPLDAIDWTISFMMSNNIESDPGFVALALLLTIWAGSPPSAALVTQMIFQVLYEPQYLAPLRSEAETAFHAHGFTDSALNDMPLMDSFISEVNRLHPTGAVTCARTVMDPRGFRFHDGLYLPAGAKVAVPTLAIQTDPQNFQDPLSFRGFRFNGADQVNAGGNPAHAADGHHRPSAATLSETNLA